MPKETNESEIEKAVKDRYSKLAKSEVNKEPSTSCCIPVKIPELKVRYLGYSAEELKSLPDSVKGLSLGCGNPVAMANLKEGETVLDLGSGGGIDVFLAAEKVGTSGKVIGLDMTPEMIERARMNADKLNFNNVEFRLGKNEDMPLEDYSVDVIISNCVINLSIDKDRVFKEAFRVLKPKGRMHISDIVTQGKLPEKVKNNLAAWSGCVAGALDEKEYLQKIKNAGFSEVKVESRYTFSERDAEIAGLFSGCCGEKSEQNDIWALIPELLGKISSVKISAYKS
ncbi:MAG: arsenite methyltransferase [Methanomassiliicoccales archaeon]|nr:MAG: arsenite methyltransferase [Methanomassiliicoccales archaeon]